MKPISIKHVHDETFHVTHDDPSTSQGVPHDETTHITQDDPSKSSSHGVKRTFDPID